MKRFLIAALLSLAVINADQIAHAEESDNSLHMGIFPRRGATITAKMFTPLSEGLSQALGRKVILETTHDFATFWQNVNQQRYDIVHYNQYHYVRSHKDLGYQVIAHNVEFGHSKIAGAILVRKDAGIHSLQDLKGKKIAFGGGRKAMQAYIATTYLLREAGLNKGDYFEQFALNPPKACIATYYHQAAAAGAGDYVLELPLVKKEIDVEEMQYLAVGEKLPHLPWAVSASVSPEMRNKIQEYMINLGNSEQGKAILKSAGLTNLLSAKDSDFDAHRRIIKVVLDEDL